MLKDFGIGFSNVTPIADLLAYADLAEQNGLGFWMNEGYHNRSAVVIMAAIASRTKKTKLGLGILSPVLRHPYLIAMEAGALDELSGGRLILGLGLAASGAKKHNIDVRKSQPLEMMRETEHILRKLLAGESTASTPMFDAPEEGVKLGFNPVRKKIPLFLGAMHSKMLELGGELFDGVLLNYACPLPYVEFAVERIRKGSINRKADSKPQVAAFVLLSVSEKHDAAVEASRKYLPHYLARAYPITLQYAHLSQNDIAPVIKAVHDSNHEGAKSAVSDEMISRLTISGTPDECIREIRKFDRAGVDQIIAEQIMGPDPLEAIRLIGREIAPKVVER